jgi:hypothetical protein
MKDYDYGLKKKVRVRKDHDHAEVAIIMPDWITIMPCCDTVPDPERNSVKADSRPWPNAAYRDSAT